MSPTRFSIERPVAISMVYLSLALLGVVALFKLPVDLIRVSFFVKMHDHMAAKDAQALMHLFQPHMMKPEMVHLRLFRAKLLLRILQTV